MTKAEFCAWLGRADPGYAVRVDMHTEILNGIGIERVLYLFGSFNHSIQSHIELYRPLPGRQGRDCYQEAIKRCQAKLPKYQRWLDEYKAKHWAGADHPPGDPDADQAS